ncbi:hypothetical protein S83_045881, partial [Arachis hypogaea]
SRTPLLEIVSKPHIKTGIEAVEHATKIQRLVRYLGVINGNMKTFSILTVRGCLQYLNLLPAKVHNSSPPNIYHHRRKCKWLAGSTLKFWDLESFELIGSTKQEVSHLVSCSPHDVQAHI